jgi:hypothetical protein
MKRREPEEPFNPWWMLAGVFLLVVLLVCVWAVSNA